ncbi:ribosyldihydronicotinamide dehydrogenase [quinone] isoform X2 [Anolis carolinensis]|uniref:ribosyldihydronicotinamide dehydrogenase [quinone] isoform X2 n=1 Tax=Anolis carolinensis TaxID=28377 RepID=UPI002F2B8714
MKCNSRVNSKLLGLVVGYGTGSIIRISLPLVQSRRCKPKEAELGESGFPTGEACSALRFTGWLQNYPEDTLACTAKFPLYWYSMPAILKGWMDRVLVQGFAFNIPKGSGSGLLKNKKALLSFTTGGNQAMYTKEGISGDISYVLWPMQFGILQFCGFDVLAPQICFAPEYAPLEERRQMLTSWEKRLKTIWEEKPIPCILE